MSVLLIIGFLMSKGTEAPRAVSRAVKKLLPKATAVMG